MINGYSDGAHDDDVTDDDDVTYQPVDFCIPVGPVFNFITGQRLRDLLFGGRSALGRRGRGCTGSRIVARPPNLAVLLTHCGQSILGKISKFDATKCQILRLTHTHTHLVWEGIGGCMRKL